MRKWHRVRIVVVLLLLAANVGWAEGAIGTFEGLVVQGNSRETGTYIYVQSKNGNMRRVRIKGARIYYADSIPAIQRTRSAAECLRGPSEVRITAEQNKSGEWNAREIMILRLPGAQIQAGLRRGGREENSVKSLQENV